MTAIVADISSEAAFNGILAKAPQVAVHFWAGWCEPCKHMDMVFSELAKDYPGTTFLRVEAEEVSDIAERFDVTAVPYFLLFQGGQVVAKVEGADVAALAAAFSRQFQAALPAAAPLHARPPPSTLAPPANKAVMTARLQELIKAAPVMLFMKGTAAAPRCGFSQKVVGILQQHGTPFNSFDILSDESVRQGLKEFSQWPTFPQLYVNSEFIGGCDVVSELHEAGELREVLRDVKPSSTPEEDHIRQLMTQHDVMLFMKGTPQEPRCGFSRRVVDALRAVGESFGSFDVLSDESVRQEIKRITDWPTFPQLLVHGELLGGCDIVTQLQQAGELKSTIEEMRSRMQQAA